MKKVVIIIFLFVSTNFLAQSNDCEVVLDELNIINIPLDITINELLELIPAKYKGYYDYKYNRKDILHYVYKTKIKLLNKERTIKMDFGFKGGFLLFYKYEINDITSNEHNIFQDILFKKTSKKRPVYTFKDKKCDIIIWLYFDHIRIIKSRI